MKHSLALEAPEFIVALTEEKFFAAFTDLAERLERKIDDRANKLEKKLEDHADDDKIIERDVWQLKNERDLIKAQTLGRSTWVALGISAPSGLVGIYTIWRIWHP